MKAHPILFSTSMVQAILEGRKSQTRRIIKIQPKHPELNFGWANMGERWHYPPVAPMIDIKCPYGQPGNTLWVKETFCYTYDTEDHPELEGCPQEQWDTGLAYKADGKPFYMFDKWEPSIFMPRTASRITLLITDIRVERLQDISDEDAIAEGVIRKDQYKTMVWEYETLWESINGKGSWDANPWVWVIKFERI